MPLVPGSFSSSACSAGRLCNRVPCLTSMNPHSFHQGPNDLRLLCKDLNCGKIWFRSCVHQKSSPALIVIHLGRFSYCRGTDGELQLGDGVQIHYSSWRDS